MEHVLDTGEYLDTVCGLLREGRGNIPVPVRGVSMRPFLRTGDTVWLEPIRGPVKPGDILLFQRPNGQYILHRVHRRFRDGSFGMLGDSQVAVEPVEADWLRGRVTHTRCRGRDTAPGSLRWWFYQTPWRWLAPFRRPIGKLHSRLKRR